MVPERRLHLILRHTALSASREGLRLADGRARLVRHGHGPEREVQTGMGPVPVGGLKSATAEPATARPLQLGAHAAVGAAHPQPGCAVAGCTVSVFGAVLTRGALSSTTATWLMVFKHVTAAARTWRW